LFEEDSVFVSEITRLEVLGFHRITPAQEEYFKSIFSVITVIPILTEVIEEAILQRKNHNLSVGDSIISATSKIFKLSLYTNNVEDFSDVKDLKLTNPLSKN